MEQLIEAILKAVQAAGIPAARAFQPGRMPRLKGAVAALALRKAVQTPAGFGGYLGVLTDKEGASKELYGMRLEADLAFTIYTPRTAGSAAGDALAEKLVQVLLGGVEGVSLRQFTVQDTAYAAEPELLYHRPGGHGDGPSVRGEHRRGAGLYGLYFER